MSTLPLFFNEEQRAPTLSILSMGLGQDSVTILLKLIYDKSFRAKYATNELLVIFSNTHNEHPETYKYRDEVIVPLCKEHGIEFYSIDNDMGYHGSTWQSLTGQWESGERNTVGSAAYPKTCTHNLKLQPQFRFVEEWISKKYNYRKGNKAGIKHFARYNGKILWMVGIARGEEKRIADAENETMAWKAQSVNTVYPLIDIGYDRQDCQDYIKSQGFELPMPSNCMFCPYVACNAMELLWLKKSYPDKFEEWCGHEQAKLDDWRHVEKNVGVSGKLHKDGERKGEAVTLMDMLRDAEARYPNVTLAELNEYKWSHGHCVTSKY